MDETKETVEESTNSTEGNQPGITQQLRQLDERLERMGKENDRAEKINQERGELLARQALGGESQAGQPQEEEKVETDKDYAEKAVSGQIKND